ncbi:MAG: gamma-glutamyltransferase [Phaeodactylibacter sp.]|nr:gamma-glutamyltransferase [Phaeodactylibacter sp.]
MRYWLLILAVGFQVACRQTPGSAPYPINKMATADHAMVVSAHPLATAAALKILQAGGNAVDAAIANQFALAVVYPRAGNIGGGGFLILRLADGSSYALDYREKAPERAFRDMYLDEAGEIIPEKSLLGHQAPGVPGTVAGLFEAHQRYGKIQEFGTLLAPAIRLAEEGFYISQAEADRLNKYLPEMQVPNTQANAFTEKTQWQPGDLLRQPDLAATLRRIQQDGRAGFYEGRTADLIVEEMQRGGGLISHADLQAYQATWRTPVTGDFLNYRIISMPPSSSGGTTLLQVLKMLEPRLPEQPRYAEPQLAHLMVECMRRAYRDRALFLGDSDHYPVPLDSLLSKPYLDNLMADYDPAHATDSDSLFAEFQVLMESFETTHSSIVDPAGNAVSLTTTINSNYGSKLLVGGAGFFLNNEMDDFSLKPWTPNQYGLIGTEANAIAPGKRMLSSMTPTIVEENGKLKLLLGTPGGSTIITSVMQVILNHLLFQMPLEAAVAAPRFHHQWLPNEIWYEEGGFDSTFLRQLETRGHALLEKKAIAKVKAITVLPDGRLQGVGDPRQDDDHAAGF